MSVLYAFAFVGHQPPCSRLLFSLLPEIMECYLQRGSQLSQGVGGEGERDCFTLDLFDGSGAWFSGGAPLRLVGR